MIDYVWGAATADAMTAVVTHRADRAPAPDLDRGRLRRGTDRRRSRRQRCARRAWQIVGSGQGSVSAAEILAELPALAAEIGKGTFAVDVRPMRLAEVERAGKSRRTRSVGS